MSSKQLADAAEEFHTAGMQGRIAARAQVGLAVWAVHGGYAWALWRAVITEWPVRLPGQQPLQLLVGREHAGQGGMDRGLGLGTTRTLAGRAVRAHELVLCKGQSQWQQHQMHGTQYCAGTRLARRQLG